VELSPECLQMDPRPCINVADLWAWEPPGVGSPRAEVCVDEGDVRLPRNPKQVPPIEGLRPARTPRRQPQLLVCHDYKGDFPLCDRWDGCLVSDCAPFLYTYLWHIDTFCYFGHKIVTIPPPSFTSLAHRHGVSVLGTFIFEHKSGSEQLSRILSTEASARKTIDKLVQIMQTWRFEGWLVNIEVEMEVREIPMLVNFLQSLTAATKKANPRATVLWYDAVCTDGKLEWQNTLNCRNREFYNVCDGIFTNYGWKAKELEECRYNRGAATVCVGIDVWGRSGGMAGWECNETVAKVLRKGLSVALFAPGWAVEAEENILGTPEDNSLRFWSSLSPVMNTRPLDFFPFKTTFCNGFSQNGKFFRLRDMDLMPHLAHSKKALVPSERGLIIKAKGKHLLWAVTGIRSNPDFRVKIKFEGPGSVAIKLDWREMKMERINEDGTMELGPMNGECLPIKTIFVVTSEPDTVLTYFEAFEVETDRCLS
ncbi:hypothetical protein PMAYCL1PPCAC_13197, partial [Pristionchus mayeri]